MKALHRSSPRPEDLPSHPPPSLFFSIDNAAVTAENAGN